MTRATADIEEWRTELLRKVFAACGATTAVRTGSTSSHSIKAKATLQVGDEMPDGMIYAGISPDTGKAMYATPADAPGTYTFNKAAKYAKKLEARGHKDFRVPTKGELDVLFNNRAAIGGFNETGSYPAGWYWSSSQTRIYRAWGQRFSDGYQGDYGRLSCSSLRLVR